ncbi:MAG TPA: FAD-binding and (Fe-S)-binding domain-containing protein, partial [Mycobacteriales bacterium]|nr:FAD-binding and (Fe-S)-binding domain-containing protein [Mycobacteriales bacterium]
MSRVFDRLAADLRGVVRGEVGFDAGSRALYATDASNYRQLPIGVVQPRDADDIATALAVCRSHDVPVLPRGGGTSLAGQCCNAAVVLDLSRHLRGIVAIDPDARTATVQPGVVLDALRAAAAPHALTFGPDPATHDHCTLGGMIGNNSCGAHSVMAGRTSDNVEALEVLTYDGVSRRVGADLDEPPGDGVDPLYAGLRELRDRCADEIRRRFPPIPRRVSGYNLDELLPERGGSLARALVGTEGTCAIVTEATVRLVPNPRERLLAVLGFTDGCAAADAVPIVMAHEPIALEGFDDALLRDVQAKRLHPGVERLLPGGGGWLLVEFGGDHTGQVLDRGRALLDAVRGASGVLLSDPVAARAVWGVRESGLGATARVPGHADTWPGWEDSAVPPDRLGDYLRELRALLARYDYHAALYGHFGQGCVHTRIDFDLASRPGVLAFRGFLEEAADLCVRFGGSLSGEHGDGQARAELLPRMFGPRLVDAFRDFKRLWDPAGRMNPGKVVDAPPLDGDLRLRGDYRPRRTKTWFAFPDDAGSFAYATQRCVGVGKCRRESGGVMCPSYQATREEQHSTRGRAHLLFELLTHDDLPRGWRDRSVREALDLCLACKGCKAECPVNVDVATYKAEFLAHYYRFRPRPPIAYATGLVMHWARLGAHAPGLANGVLAAPVLGPALRALAGVAPQRRPPRLVSSTFQRQLRRRRLPAGSRRVVLWPDTFTNHFAPSAGHAAVDVLAAAGFGVEVPDGFVCCGRPLHDSGMLRLARRRLRATLDVLAPAVEAGAAVVVLEPSCASVLRDELPAMLPDDPRAPAVAAATSTLPALLAADSGGWMPLGRVDAPVLVQPHCHDRSVLGFGAEV